MAQPLRRHHRSPQWLRRLDRAAAGMNPFLTLMAIGLALLYVTCLVLLVLKIPIVHLRAYPSGAATENEPVPTTVTDIRARMTY